jgi:4-amino-4-deoxy-L-arabinose transferase-like glycosyltransferase
MGLTAAQRGVLRSTVLAGALAAVVLLTRLGHNRLTDWDEGIYAGISRAMVGPSWVVPDWSARPWLPWWNGQPWLEKPPLMLWITAIFFRLFGVSEFTARLGSALSGVALVALLHGWLTLRRSTLAGWCCTIMLLSTFGFLHVARVGEMDVLLSLGCAMALIGLCELDRNNPAAWLLFWVGFAIALMTKGAASITLPITLLLTLATNRLSVLNHTTNRLGAPHLDFEMWAMWARHQARAFTLGLLLFLAIVLPWHLTMLHRFGHLFLDQYLGLHVLTRATSQIEGHLTPWWFYLRVLLVSAAPWVLLYPFALWHTLTNPAPTKPGCPIHARSLGMSGSARGSIRPFALFALVVLLLFSIAQTRLPHYIAPIYPALSVVTAIWLEARLRPRLLASPNPRAFALKSAAAALAAFALAALLTAAPRRSLHAPRLPNGDTTPDNREEIALLKQALPPPSAQTPPTERQLLFLRAGGYNPIPAVAFYAARPVQQVILGPQPPSTRIEIYTNDPVPLTTQLHDREPHLLLADRALAAQLPPELIFEPIATGPTMVLGRVRLR